MDSLSDNERRWIVAGICLTKVLTPVVRNVLGSEIQIWYHHLCKPPDEIDKQVFSTFKKKLPPSRFLLQYKNINNNNVRKSSSAYDYAVKDPLSLAKLFVQPFMAMFTGFNESMDMSAVLAVMCEAYPFVTTGAAADAKTVRSDIRNKWAHCNFSDWTEPTFLAALQGMQSLAKKINLSSADEKALCDSLDDWKDKGTQLCCGQPVNSDLLKLVTEEVAELRTSVEKWIFQSDTEMDTVKEKLDNMFCRIKQVETLAADNSKRVKRHSEELEHHSNQLGSQSSQLECHSNELECHSNELESHSNELESHSNQLECHSNQLGSHSSQLESHSSELESHSNKLKHLTKKLNEEDDVRQKENYSEFAERKAPYGLRNLPRQIVERRSEVDKVQGLLMKENKVGVVGSLSGDVIGIRGMGGLGKTVLAQAVALDASKSRQVIWLDIGETPDCLVLINILIKVLGGTVSFSDIPATQSWIKADTSDKDCLVVLDDVWSVDDAAVFDHLSGKCQLLITTRDANVVRGLGGSAYELDTMTPDQSRALLYKYAGVTPDEQSKLSSNMQLIVSKLLDQCRGLPLALSLVGSNLIHTRTEEDWQDILEDLERADLERLRSLFSTDAYPHRNLLAAIDVSFQRLEESAREKFLDFAIFPEDIDIPSDILELFWSSIGTDKEKIACNPRESRYILAVLESKSLIQKGRELQGKTSYRVHDLLLDFARAKLRASRTLTDVQCSFVKTLRGQCVNGEWNITSSTYQKDYYFKYLPYHIFSSEQHDELLQLFFDFQWLEQKTKETDLPSLIADLRFLHTQPQEIKLLKKSLSLSQSIIERNPDSIGQQLLGYLLSYVDKYPCVNKLVKDIRDTYTKSCHLLPLSSWLELEGPELFTKNVDSPLLSLVTSNTSTGTIVISGLYNGLIKIHELETGKELKVLVHGGRGIAGVTSLALSHSKTMLASSSFRQTILWEMNTYEQRFVLPASYVVDFSVDDRRLYTGSSDGQLKMWCVITGELLGLVPAHNKQISSLCTTEDGLYIATASKDSTIKLWRADTLVYETTLVGHTHAVTCVVATNLGNDNQGLVSGSWDGTLKIWDVNTYQEIRTLSDSDCQDVLCCFADTKHIISGSYDNIVRLWCFHKGELLSCFEGHGDTISSVTVIDDGSKALSGSDDGTFRVWNLGTSVHMKQDRSRGHSEEVSDIAVTRDGSRCVSASWDGTLKVWDCHAGKECFTLTGLKGVPQNVAIAADDRHFVTLSEDVNCLSIKVWDLLKGNEITALDDEESTSFDNGARIVRFSSDTRKVIIGCRNRVFIWDWQNHDVPLKSVTLPADRTEEITCDGNMTYTCSEDATVCQIDLGSLKVSTVCQCRIPVVITPDGKAILFRKVSDNSLIYYEFSTDSEVAYIEGHPDASIITAIDITTDGKLVLSGSSSGTISLVDLKSSNVVQTFTETEAGVGIRLVSVLRDVAHFVFVDEANRVVLRTFNNKEAELVLDQPAVKVTCITTHSVNYVFLGCENGELLLFDIYATQYKYNHHAHSEAVSQVKSNPTGFLHLLVSGSASGRVTLWCVSTTVPPLWSQIWSHDNVYPHPIADVAFVPHSEDIVIGSCYDNKVYRIDAAGIVNTYVLEFYGEGIYALRAVNDCLIAVSWRSSATSLRVVEWSLNEGLMTETFRVSTPTRYIVKRVNNAFNHVALMDEESLLIWNLESGTVLHRVPFHADPDSIRALALVSGGEFLLSAALCKNSLKLWNLRNGLFIEEFQFDQDVEVIACASNGMICVCLKGGRVCFLRFNNLSSHSGLQQ